jgi:hypothetical protein
VIGQPHPLAVVESPRLTSMRRLGIGASDPRAASRMVRSKQSQSGGGRRVAVRAVPPLRMQAEPSRTAAPAARRLITSGVLMIADDLLAEYSEQV